MSDPLRYTAGGVEWRYDFSKSWVSSCGRMIVKRLYGGTGPGVAFVDTVQIPGTYDTLRNAMEDAAAFCRAERIKEADDE